MDLGQLAGREAGRCKQEASNSNSFLASWLWNSGGRFFSQVASSDSPSSAFWCSPRPHHAPAPPSPSPSINALLVEGFEQGVMLKTNRLNFLYIETGRASWNEITQIPGWSEQTVRGWEGCGGQEQPFGILTISSSSCNILLHLTSARWNPCSQATRWSFRITHLTRRPMWLDFKQHHFYIQIWKSRFSNLNIPIFKFEYPEAEIGHWDIEIFKFEYPDIQIWISQYLY